ncbi:uncharacterized protein [Oryza sativa Japonica Group]|uniref:uncharacterized protein n=1 Tax=Oryza sativa subsp. japonica TaxID=39947 RepID=UPI000E1BD05C|nr:uncharacterized protein LOC112936842 [Oryza sativa Japonica Group]
MQSRANQSIHPTRPRPPPGLAFSRTPHVHLRSATSSPRAASPSIRRSLRLPLSRSPRATGPAAAMGRRNASKPSSDRFSARVKAVTGALPAARKGGEVKASTLSQAEDLTADLPFSPLAHHVLGHVRAAVGEDALALVSLRRAIELAPGDLGIAFTLAKRYAAREQFDLAAEECQRALGRGDADLVDPQLHAVFEPRHLEPSKEARISTAKNRLKQLLVDALSKIAIPMARDRWNGMSEETRRSFLTVGIDEMVAYYCAKSSDECQMSALTGALDFVKDNREWICWLCPQCEMTFLTAKTFQLHVEEDEFSRSQEFKESLLFVPERISDEQTEFIKCWTLPSDVNPTEEAEGEKILTKIKSTFQYLKDQKALSVDLFDNLIKFRKNRIEEAVTQNYSCITSLDPGGLLLLGTYLDLLRLRVGDAEQDSRENFGGGVVQDACVLSIGTDENVLRVTDGSSNQDALFSWLSRPSRQDPFTSWDNMRQACLDKGTHALGKLNGRAAALIEKVNLKRGLTATQTYEAYFGEKAKIDIEIMQLGAEVDNLKKNLLEVCTYDYREIILPAMKDFLWAKLCNVPPKGVSSSEDDKVAEASIENRDPVQEDINVEIVLQEDDEKGAKDNREGGDSNLPHDYGAELPGDSKVDGAWGSSPGDRAGPPLPVRPGALGEVLSSWSVCGRFARVETHKTRAMYTGSGR